MSFVERVRDFVIEHDLLRRTVTVPLKALILATIATAIVVVAIIAHGRIQRNLGQPPVTAADVAALRASVDALRSEVAKVCIPPAPPRKR